ncbi:hypothetical protein ES708_10107 [subsurface metagenome]
MQMSEIQERTQDSKSYKKPKAAVSISAGSEIEIIDVLKSRLECREITHAEAIRKIKAENQMLLEKIGLDSEQKETEQEQRIADINAKATEEISQIKTKAEKTILKIKTEVTQKLNLYAAAVNKAQNETAKLKAIAEKMTKVKNEVQKKSEAQSQEISVLRAELEEKTEALSNLSEQAETKEKSKVRTDELDCRLFDYCVRAKTEAENDLVEKTQTHSNALAKAKSELAEKTKAYTNTIARLKNYIEKQKGEKQAPTEQELLKFKAQMGKKLEQKKKRLDAVAAAEILEFFISAKNTK